MANTLLQGEHLEVRLVCATQDQISVNVCHYEVGSVTGPVTDAEAAGIINVGVNELYEDLLSEHAAYRGVSVQIISRDPKPLPAPVPAMIAGTILGDMLPKQTAGVITKKTDFAGRRYRGRLYIPFPGEASNDVDSTPVAQYVADSDALGAYLFQTIPVAAGTAVAQLLPVLRHRDKDGETGDIVYSYSYITAYRPNDLWGTQRRRGDYGRQNRVPF